jgi:hypothetical protein
VASIDTTPVSGSFFAAASAEGITLYEPFGGMCAGLHMCLALGLRVNRYLYSDTSGAARQVAEHRLAQLHGLYPASFPLQAAADTFTALPQDVRQVDAAALKAAGAADGSQWLVVAGWECQDLSTAGKGKGVTAEQAAQLQAERVKAQQAARPAEALIPTAKQREVDELARQLDGRVVRKSLKRGDGTVQHLYGRLCFRGRLTKWPKHFRVEFANGTSQLITFKTAKAWLQPEGAQPPADEPVLLSVVLLSTTELADTWQLHQPDAVCHALEGLTGLHVRQAEGEQLAAAVRGHVVEALPGHVGTVLRQMPQAVLQVLLGAINLHTVGHVLDPWHCTMQLGPLLQQHGPASIRLSTNTVVHPPARRAEGHSEHLALDPLQPASYRTWLRAAPAEVGIFKPPADLADMALAIALAFCSSAVCMLVPNTYLTDSSYFRSGWFARLQQEGVLVTLPCPKTKPAAVWVLVFKSAAARRRLMSAK